MRLSRIIERLTHMYDAYGDIPVYVYNEKLAVAPECYISEILHEDNDEYGTACISIMIREEE